MKRVVSVLLLFAPLTTAQLNAQKIQHVIVIFQENRSTDNMFQDPVLVAEGADIASSGLNSKGQIIKLQPQPLRNNYDIAHGHNSFELMYDNGKMDGADQLAITCRSGPPKCPPAAAQFKYVNPAEVAPYFQLAEQYTFADRMFQTNQGPSFPAHQFIISGTSAPFETSDLFAAENPLGAPDTGDDTGCTSPVKEYVEMIDPVGNESSRMYPCFEHTTLFDLLDAKGISWRYYTESANTIWTGPNAIKHIRFGEDWNNVILNPKQVLSDISGFQLPAVSWVIPNGAESDHPSFNLGTGPSWVASIVNAVGNSPYWSDTAIFITWDDWGGWYDHVAPPIYDSYEYGFRVPMIVVSAYARQHYISHVDHDFGSILKFIEEKFDLGSLGFADSRADNLSDCFDFTKRHSFRTIPAPYDANYFLHDKTPPIPLDDD
jgi:phospholipase C